MNKGLYAILIAAAALLANTAAAQSVRNMSTIISGKLSISGSTNRSALSDDALKELCEQGYTLAVFTYGGARARTVSCGGGREITYSSITSWERPGTIVSKVQSAIANGGRALVHCWYGVHASKFVAAAALTELCGYSGERAARFFERGIPEGSLSPARIRELSGKLESLRGGGRVVSGCP